MAMENYDIHKLAVDIDAIWGNRFGLTLSPASHQAITWTDGD